MERGEKCGKQKGLHSWSGLKKKERLRCRPEGDTSGHKKIWITKKWHSEHSLCREISGLYIMVMINECHLINYAQLSNYWRETWRNMCGLERKKAILTFDVQSSFHLLLWNIYSIIFLLSERLLHKKLLNTYLIIVAERDKNDVMEKSCIVVIYMWINKRNDILL